MCTFSFTSSFVHIHVLDAIVWESWPRKTPLAGFRFSAGLGGFPKQASTREVSTGVVLVVSGNGGRFSKISTIITRGCLLVPVTERGFQMQARVERAEVDSQVPRGEVRSVPVTG